MNKYKITVESIKEQMVNAIVEIEAQSVDEAADIVYDMPLSKFKWNEVGKPEISNDIEIIEGIEV